MNRRPSHPLVVILFPLALLGCDYDPGWDRDYVADPETDLEEDAAEEALVDELDELDDLDPVPEDPGSSDPFGPRTQELTQVAATGPFSILEDLAFLGFVERPGLRVDPCQRPADYGDYDAALSRKALEEAQRMGADVIRVKIIWRDVVPGDPCAVTRPGYPFRPGAQDGDGGYEWRPYDIVLQNAAELGLKVLFTLSAPIPFWASSDPGYCDRRNQAARQPRPGWTGGDASCSWKPDVDEYERFALAVGRHFKKNPNRRAIFGLTLWNEPNLPSFLADGRLGPDDKVERSAYLAGLRYRSMYFVAFKRLRKTAGLRTRIFFGDHPGTIKELKAAATGDRWDVLWHALCLPGRAQGAVKDWELSQARAARSRCPAEEPQDDWCARKNRWIHATGVAFHPYAPSPGVARDAVEKVRDDLIRPAAAACRLKNTGRSGLPRDRIYLTEYGVLSTGASSNIGGAPPVPLNEQPQHIALTERAMHELGVRSVAQYELFDEGRGGPFETGLRHSSRLFQSLVDNSLAVDAEIAQNPGCQIPNYISAVAKFYGIPIPLDSVQPDPNLPDKVCVPRYEAFQLRWQGPDPQGTDEEKAAEWARRCEAPAGFLRCAPKPAYDAYVMPLVLGRAAGGKADLFVLSRPAQKNPFLVEGFSPPPNDMTPVPIGGDAVIMQTDSRGYAHCPDGAGRFRRCEIPVGDFVRVRVTDTLAGLSRVVPVTR